MLPFYCSVRGEREEIMHGRAAVWSVVYWGIKGTKGCSELLFIFSIQAGLNVFPEKCHVVYALFPVVSGRHDAQGGAFVNNTEFFASESSLIKKYSKAKDRRINGTSVLFSHPKQRLSEEGLNLLALFFSAVSM